MKTKAATATIFTTTFCFIFINIFMAPFALADDYPVSSGAPNAVTQDFVPIVPDSSNCGIPDNAPYASSSEIPATVPVAGDTVTPGLVPFDLAANRNYQLPGQELQPSTDVLPSQNLDSASTPNVNGQMPLIQQAPQAAASTPAQGFAQTSQTETQTPQEWRKPHSIRSQTTLTCNQCSAELKVKMLVLTLVPMRMEQPTIAMSPMAMVRLETTLTLSRWARRR